ncbi:hypothetical protein [Mucilaginibacter sp. OK283]|jgi:hypothetical protein|uniref:hypothetical protein n=1 Tax=Mucilaginibacter sp. OK283 TaxID=1881049 RepID=UPI0008D20478|nr:hypothetical protein [Mucilaginibacter sp. OK283]SEP12126.1 hypothetical protein SAMN05428947_10734 [Mucilaginibacter sp. OK283]
MSQEIARFWNWFKEQGKQLADLNRPGIADDEKEELLDAILYALHQYCDQLFFDIGGLYGEEQEFVVTAEGNVDYFSKVEELIDDAPEIEGWLFTAFMPPRDLEYTRIFEDVELKPLEMWFLPLNNSKEPKSIGLRICLPNYELVANSKWLQAAVYKILDTALGEKAFALDIDYIEIKGMPPGKPEDFGLIELKDLSAFVKWKKKKLAAL